MNVFISQPMSGLDIAEIKAARERAYEELKDIFPNTNIMIIDNLQEGEEKSNLEYLSTDLLLLDDADVVYYLKGWEKSKGCMVEFTVCQKYNIPMLFE